MFFNGITLNRHITQYCEMFQDKFYTERSLNKHKKGHHTTIPSKSKLQKDVADKSKFKEHESIGHNQVCVEYNICKTEFNMEINLKEQIERNHTQQRFICDLCKREFMMKLL